MSMYLVAGVEIHIQLATKTKAFSGSSTEFGQTPNSQASEIDIGMPGTLPVVNQEMLRQAIMLGTVLNCQVQNYITFARKHYFYPDLPKGYQITQDEHPILVGGELDFLLPNGEKESCLIHHAHLEEDAGKSLHGYQSGKSGVDLNRAGQPLLEIVTDPCLYSIEHTVAFLKTLHSIVTYLGICDGNMQEGSFRCDINISLRESSDAPLGTRVEIKNINSFKFIQRAMEYEVDRQTDLLESGGTIHQETRLYNEKTGKTESMRSKENLCDYRYFKDPDLPAIWISEAFISDAQQALPEHPTQRTQRYANMGIPEVEARIIAYNRAMGDYFDATHAIFTDDPVMIANWLLGSISALANKDQIKLDQSPISPKDLAELLEQLHSGTISSKMAKEISEIMWSEKKSPKEIIAQKGFKQMNSTEELKPILTDLLNTHPKQVSDYRAGKEKLFGFFVGQAMKATKGQANPDVLHSLLKELLHE